ncbi:MAG: DUF4328 domain-containing protein [Candidatus Rokuibacteriota bacterium]
MALALVLVLGLDIVLAWMVIQGAYLYLGMVWHGLAGELLPPGAIETHGRQFLALRRIQAVAWLATILLFLVWLRRAQDLARSPDGGSGWGTIAAFLVPGPNLVRPVRLVSALWHDSGPRRAAPRGRVPWWVGWWWALVLAAALAHALAAGLAGDQARPLDLGGPMQLLLLAEVLEIAAAVLAILVVRRITDRQEDARALT